MFESDEEAHLHSHPWHYLSFVLKGGYIEELSEGVFREIKRFGLNFRRATEYRKLTLVSHPTVSIFFAFGEYRAWGYETPEGHINHSEYRRRKFFGTLPR